MKSVWKKLFGIVLLAGALCVGQMALVLPEDHLSVFIQHDELDRGGAYVDACLIRFHGEPLFSCRCDLAVKESRRIFRLLL